MNTTVELAERKTQTCAQSQYAECVCIGGNKIAMNGMAMQGTNWTSAYGRRSLQNLYGVWTILSVMPVRGSNSCLLKDGHAPR